MNDKSIKQNSLLIVDDELVVRDSLSKWFKQDGYRVDTAEDANHAIKKMNDGPWNVILLDIKMPGMSGLELQKRLREIDPSISTIMITAFASVESAVQALKGRSVRLRHKAGRPGSSLPSCHECAPSKETR